MHVGKSKKSSFALFFARVLEVFFFFKTILDQGVGGQYWEEEEEEIYADFELQLHHDLLILEFV